MAQVKGIGGIFLFSSQAANLVDWYEQVLGVHFDRHPDGGDRFYTVFFTRDFESGIIRENPVFAINQAEEPIHTGGPSYLLNLRVDDLDTILEKLREKNVPIDPKIQVWKRGKHAWITDPDGNRIELYEEIIVDDQKG